jgi:hypothetical protein
MHKFDNPQSGKVLENISEVMNWMEWHSDLPTSFASAKH